MLMPVAAVPPPKPPAVQAQVLEVGTQGLPPALEALIQADDWPGVADWFEKASPKVRRQYYEYWLQALNRSQRWARLADACKALTPQIEGRGKPRLGTYRLYRAQALSQLGRHKEAMAAHAENGRLGQPEGYANACVEARLAGDWKALLAYSGAILARKPTDPEALGSKGEALSHLGRFDEATAVLKQAVQANPKAASAWNNLGRAALQHKAWADAQAAFDRALKLEPGQMEALFNRGIARFNLKQYAASRDDFKAALALRPGDPVLQENLRQAEKMAAAYPQP
ncbi:tetratricopeptide repeat protein [Geothrix paludis]|uniref:tetratricopeptide repeat protein n=1 Tax=Geothrix paludis TaxID=2922722 RepID=UPI001FAC0533|nr:tetratricopeptide repeat protein [Geothrix paludis]